MMPGDFVPIAGMVFSLLLALVIGGFILMYPLTKRLARLMEMKIEERREVGDDAGGGRALTGDESAALRELRLAMESLELEVARLAERQAFAERLLEKGGADR